MQARTLCDIFYHSVDTYRKPQHLVAKRAGSWQPISSENFRRAVEELSMGLRALGLEKGAKVAILSENRPEWAYADLAILTAAAVDVPVYATLVPQQIAYILNDSEASFIFVSNLAQANKVAEIRAEVPKLEHVILPLYYRSRDEYVDVMRHCIALNGSFFNTQRMMQQYVLKAYFA